jgi:hypothetical protein
VVWEGGGVWFGDLVGHFGCIDYKVSCVAMWQCSMSTYVFDDDDVVDSPANDILASCVRCRSVYLVNCIAKT